MAWGALGALRDLPRLHEIVSVLVRHGLGDLVRRIGVGSVLERAGRIVHWREAREVEGLETPERLRLALEQLGPTFVKLGQMFSTREDLFPPRWITEFEKLQSRVAPVPFEELLPQVEAALGRSPFETFAELDRRPAASASIAQVHRARLADGTAVVLKVRRPGIEAVVEADLRILEHLARLLESEVPEARRYQPLRILEEFARSLTRELDLAREGRNTDRFARSFRDDPVVMVPRVYWEWTSPVMNVQEYIDAIPGTDLAAVDAAGLDRRVLAARGADAVLKMILVDGFFHADPHPGNVLYLPGNRLVLIDCGMVGQLTEPRQRQILALLGGIARRDEGAMLEVVLDWTGDAHVDEVRLAADLAELVFDYADMPIKELRMSALLRQVTGIMRQHSIVLPPDLALLFKALVTLEGLCRQYDPDFRLVEHIGPFVERAAAERYRPAALLRRGQEGLGELHDLVTGVPRDLARILREARRGRLRIDLDLKRLDSFGRKLDSAIDRITIGILTAAVIVGSSIIMTVPGGPSLFGIPLLLTLGLLGYLVAVLNSLWLVLSIWRAHRD